MTAAADRATAVQLLRAAAADHLTHLEPGERDELVERITGALDRCARHRAAEELRAAAEESTYWVMTRETVYTRLNEHADALEAE